VCQSLNTRITIENEGRYVLGVEGYVGATLFKCMENYAKVTKDSKYKIIFDFVKGQGRGWDLSEKGGLQSIIALLGVAYSARQEPAYEEVIEQIDDREEKGMKPGEQMNKVIEDKGMSGFEAFALMNKKIVFYGLENQDLLSIQTKLSYGEADEHFYRVAKIRSRAMYNNLIDLMDKEKRDRALVHVTGFHHLIFKELAKANGVKYESVFVHNLPRYEQSLQHHK